MMLEENPLLHAVAVQSAKRVPSGLQSAAYWELYCYTGHLPLACIVFVVIVR